MRQAARKKRRLPRPTGAPPGEVVPLSRKRPRVLVADDDPALRRALAIALDCDGYEVVEAEDGDVLLNLIADQVSAAGPRCAPAELIVTDVRMPGFTGLQAMAAIRQLALDTPVIVISAYLTPAVEAQALSLGAAAAFKKPFDVDDLRTAVANLVQGPLRKRR